MLLTARTCLEKGYRFVLSCPRCASLRVYYGGLAETMIARGKGDAPLRTLFDDGAFVCRRHRAPANFLAVEHDRACTIDEIARWTKKSPAVEGGAK